MKIAFTTKGEGWDAKIDPRFGRTEYLVFLDEETKNLEVIDNTAIQNEAHGAGPKTAQMLLENKPNILITGNGPGGNAATVLQRGNLEIFIGASDLSVKEAYDKYKNGELKKF